MNEDENNEIEFSSVNPFEENVIYDQAVFVWIDILRFSYDIEIIPYTNSPDRFKGNTLLGFYNPDRAVLVEADGREKLYSVVETKGSDALRPTEQARIDCGKAYF